MSAEPAIGEQIKSLMNRMLAARKYGPPSELGQVVREIDALTARLRNGNTATETAKPQAETTV